MQTLIEQFNEAEKIRAAQLAAALPDLRIKEGTAMEGMYVITLADVVTEEAKEWERQAAAARDRGDTKTAKGYMDMLNNKYGHEPQVVHNLIPTVGRSVLAQRLANTTTYTGIINKVALGTGTTPAANGDTTLGTETYRNNAASLTYSNNIAYITGFFTAAETNGTYAEVGLFIDGTASANTGQLFSRALASITKSSIQTLTIDWIITIS
jgi:hypothetical protein